MIRRSCVIVLLTLFIQVTLPLAPAASSGTLTCLTGSDPVVAGDFSAITAVRELIDANDNCPCTFFDGSEGKGRRDYLKCVRRRINREFFSGNLRSQCIDTVLDYYRKSTCGRDPSLHTEPCIETNLASGKVTCTITPFTKQDGFTPTDACTDRGGQTKQVPAPAWDFCIDAADTNSDLRIDEADTGNPLPPPPRFDALALQGLRSNTLVAGKTTALRLFTEDPTYVSVDSLRAAILRPDGSRLVKSWPRSEVVSVPDSSRGPSLVALVPGAELPWIGGYLFETSIFDARGALLARYSIDDVQLLPTKDLRVGIDRVNASSVNPGTPAEIEAANTAMERMAALYPIRDGISGLDGDRSAGLRYEINNNPQGYGCDGNPAHSDCQLCPFFGSWLDRPSDVDSIDLGIAYRFPDPGEPCGGSGPHFCEQGTEAVRSLPWGSFVWWDPISHPALQETAHGFGLEPPEDPHYDPLAQPGHSKDLTIDAVDAELGFDIQFNQPFPSPTYDIMYPSGPCPGRAPATLSLNSWDWEYLRQQIVNLPSTGPTPPAHFATDAAPAVAGVGDNVYFLAKRADGRIYYNRAVLGEAGKGWVEMEGEGRTDTAPAAGAVGTHLFVAVKGLGGNLYLNQADLAQPFGQWFPMNFATDVPPAVAGVGNSVFVFARGLDGRIFLNQAELGHSFSGWFEVQGDGRTDAAPAAASVGTHVFVAVKGLDGNIYLNQADFGQAFGQWFPMDFATDVSPALAGVGNSVFVFAKSLDGRIYLNQAELGQSFSGWFEVQGDGRTEAAPAAGAVGTHVFVAVKGLNQLVYVNQADLGSAFGEWFP